MNLQSGPTTASHRRQPYRTRTQNRLSFPEGNSSPESPASQIKNVTDAHSRDISHDTESDIRITLSSHPSKPSKTSTTNMQAPALVNLRPSRDCGYFHALSGLTADKIDGHRFGKTAAGELEDVAETGGVADSVKVSKTVDSRSWRARSTASRPSSKQVVKQPEETPSSQLLPNHALQPAQQRDVTSPAIVKQPHSSPSKTRTSSTTSEPTPRATPFQTQSIANTVPIHPRRASVPIALASYPHASVPSIPYTQVPDLNRIRPIAPLRVAEQLLLSEPCQLPRTREFDLAPPPYSDADIPMPEPYNEAYPHPLTSYASPGVNPNAVVASGYDLELAKLMETDRSKALGTILATCDRPGITAPTLAKHLRSYIPDGNGIPGFDNEGAARAVLGSVGAAMCRSDERLSELTGSGASGIQPVFTPALSHVPPRLAAQARSDNRLRDVKPLSISVPISLPFTGRDVGYGYQSVTPPSSPYERRSSLNSQYSDYFSVPPHPAAARRISVVSVGTDSDGQYSTIDSYDRSQPALLTPAPMIYPFSQPPQPQSPSLWYKTELCPAYQESGQCRYGKGCQFAHGLQELRLPMGRVPFPEVNHESTATEPTRVHPVPKIDIRRASAPHSQLPTVEEVDDDHCYHLHGSGRRSSEATEVPPIGFERLIRSDSIARLTMPRQPAQIESQSQSQSNRELSSSMSSDMPWTPNQSLAYSPSSPLKLAPGQSSFETPPGLHARASQSSLSQTSSGAGHSPKRYGAIGNPNDFTPTETNIPTHSLDIPSSTYGFPSHQSRRHLSSPSSNDAESSASWASRSPSDSAGGQVAQPTTSASVEFSTGRSIWC